MRDGNIRAVRDTTWNFQVVHGQEVGEVPHFVKDIFIGILMVTSMRAVDLRMREVKLYTPRLRSGRIPRIHKRVRTQVETGEQQKSRGQEPAYFTLILRSTE